jgi:hypothetical protein
MLHRADLQAIALAKYKDAELLFANRRYSNSYYLFGYAVEIGLKARIARSFLPETIPDRRFVSDIFQHDLTKLVGLAGLSGELAEERKRSNVFDGHWATVSSWSEQSRYDMIDEFLATAMKVAMTDQSEGIFAWLQRHW